MHSRFLDRFTWVGIPKRRRSGLKKSDRKNRRKSPHHCTSRRKLIAINDRSSNPNDILGSFKNMDPNDQLKLLRGLIDNNQFNIYQLRALRSTIDERSKMDIISHVPYEIALYILSFLSPKDLSQAAQACRSWRTVCEDNRLWREKCKEEGLLNDDLTINALFRKRIINNEILWREAYLKHMSILNNWRNRSVKIISESFIHCCHEESVITCLQYNPKTNTIVSGSDDQTLKVWSSETGRCIATLEGHTGGVWCSQLSPEDIVISGSTDRTLKVWKAHTGELLHTLYGHTSTVRCLALDGDYVASGSRDTTLRLWDIRNGRCIHVLAGHAKAVRCVEYKNNIVVSGAYDHVVMVWNSLTGTCLHVLECHTNRIYSLQFDGKTIASGSLDSTICIWDATTGKLNHKLEGHTSLISKMQLRGNVLVSANADSSCKVWDISTGRCLQTLDGESKHTGPMTSVYFNNRHVITSSDDGTVKLWDIRTGEFIRNLIVLPTAGNGGVVWRIRASYTKLICAVGSRTQTDDTHILVLDFNE